MLCNPGDIAPVVAQEGFEILLSGTFQQFILELCVAFMWNGGKRCVVKALRQVMAIDFFRVLESKYLLNQVDQFTDIPRPGIIF